MYHTDADVKRVPLLLVPLLPCWWKEIFSKILTVCVWSLLPNGLSVTQKHYRKNKNVWYFSIPWLLKQNYFHICYSKMQNSDLLRSSLVTQKCWLRLSLLSWSCHRFRHSLYRSNRHGAICQIHTQLLLSELCLWVQVQTCTEQWELVVEGGEERRIDCGCFELGRKEALKMLQIKLYFSWVFLPHVKQVSSILWNYSKHGSITSNSWTELKTCLRCFAPQLTP